MSTNRKQIEQGTVQECDICCHDKQQQTDDLDHEFEDEISQPLSRITSRSFINSQNSSQYLDLAYEGGDEDQTNQQDKIQLPIEATPDKTNQSSSSKLNKKYNSSIKVEMVDAEDVVQKILPNTVNGSEKRLISMHSQMKSDMQSKNSKSSERQIDQPNQSDNLNKDDSLQLIENSATPCIEKHEENESHFQAPLEQQSQNSQQNLGIADSQNFEMKGTLEFNPSEHNFIIPPPEALMPKRLFPKEEARSGAGIAFMKLQQLRGKELIERMNPDKNGQRRIRDARGDIDIEDCQSISDYIISSWKNKKLIYCRYGEKYITDLEKRKKSSLAESNLPSQNLASASYLLNIKRLIEEYNTDTDKKDLKKLKMDKIKPGDSGSQQMYKLQGPNDRTLLFESRFESGNLLAVVKESDTEYDLILQNDINTNGHTQWFFYRIGNTTKGTKVRFNIINLAKPDSLYNYGMKVLCYSSKIKNFQGVGWHRVGQDIDYYQNAFKKDGNPKLSRKYYTLTFVHTLTVDDDNQFFAHCFPYTYTDLQDDISRIEKDPYTQNFFHRSALCRTLAGNRCDMITITSKDKDPQSAKALAKKGVILSARVHPGESNSSWMMKGIIDFLVSNAIEARVLREHFVFKIIPMINVDGVINGNYRCSLSGQDLNRRYKNPSKQVHPVIFNIKKLIRPFARERECVLFCDLHGHSRRKNIFMYGNNIRERPHATRVFPYIFSKLCDFFSFESSRFSMSKYKESTARISMFKELNIANIFTLEASFCGADKGKYKDQHFTTEYLRLAGRRLMECLIVYCKINVPETIKQIKAKRREKKEEEDKDDQQIDENKQYELINTEDIVNELTQNKQLIKMTSGGEDDASSGSDSEPSADNLEEEEMAQVVPVKPKNPPVAKPQVKPPPSQIKKPPPLIIQKPKKPQSPQAQSRKNDDLRKLQAQQQAQKKKNFPLFDKGKKAKPEMVDAWTQTTPRTHDENRKRRREQRELQHKNQQLQQQQQQQAALAQQMQLQNPGQLASQNLRQYQISNLNANKIPHFNQNSYQYRSPQRNDPLVINDHKVEIDQKIGVTGAAAAFIKQQKNSNKALESIGEQQQLSVGQPALFQNEMLNQIQQQRLKKKNSEMPIKQDEIFAHRQSKELILNDPHSQGKYSTTRSINNQFQNQTTDIVRRQRTNENGRIDEKAMLDLNQQIKKNPMNPSNKRNHSKSIPHQNSNTIKQELLISNSIKKPYGQFSTTPYQHSKNNLIPIQNNNKSKHDESLLPDISGTQSQQSQQRQKRQSFHQSNNFSQDNDSKQGQGQYGLKNARSPHFDVDLNNMTKYQHHIKQKSGLSVQNYQSYKNNIEHIQAQILSHNTSPVQQNPNVLTLPGQNQLQYNQPMAHHHQSRYNRSDVIMKGNPINPNMTLGNFSHKMNRSLIPAGLGNSQYQPTGNLEGQINQFAVGQSQLHGIPAGASGTHTMYAVRNQRSLQQHHDHQMNPMALSQIQKSMHATQNLAGASMGAETKVSMLNQSQAQGRSQFIFKELNSPMGKQNSKKFNNSLAINHTDVKVHQQQQNNQLHGQQMHFHLAKNPGETLHFKSVNQSIDQTVKGMQNTFDFHSALPDVMKQQQLSKQQAQYLQQQKIKLQHPVMQNVSQNNHPHLSPVTISPPNIQNNLNSSTMSQIVNYQSPTRTMPKMGTGLTRQQVNNSNTQNRQYQMQQQSAIQQQNTNNQHQKNGPVQSNLMGKTK